MHTTERYNSEGSLKIGTSIKKGVVQKMEEFVFFNERNALLEMKGMCLVTWNNIPFIFDRCPNFLQLWVDLAYVRVWNTLAHPTISSCTTITKYGAATIVDALGQCAKKYAHSSKHPHR